MAEIKVERKSPSVWPWVIGLLILALLVWGLTELLTDSSEPVLTDQPNSAVQAEPAPFPEASTAPAGISDTTGTIPDAQGMTADTAR